MATEGRPFPELWARPEEQTEWWYYHGHLNSRDRQFAFHLAFFRRRADDIWIGSIVPVQQGFSHLHFAHFGFTDFSTKKFHYGHLGLLHARWAAQVDRFEVHKGSWFARAYGGGHEVHACLRGCAITLNLKPVKPASRIVPGGGFYRAVNQFTRHMAFTRMDVHGAVSVGKRVFDVTGVAWMEREFGDFQLDSKMPGWDWFGLQLDDGREVMVYALRQTSGNPSARSRAAIIEGDGTARYSDGPITVEPLDRWVSPDTGIVYPCRWRLGLGKGSLIEVKPALRCHELDTRGSTYMAYWEGPVCARGTLEQTAVRGTGFVELVGYDYSPGKPTVFDFARKRIGLRAVLAGEICARLHRDGRIIGEEPPPRLPREEA